MDYNQRKAKVLGENPSTAQHKLKKLVLFDILQTFGLDLCYRCELPIETVEQLSLEHIQPWLNAKNPRETFYDLDNISFSHLTCNISHASKPTKKYDTLQEKKKAEWSRYYAKNSETLLKRKRERYHRNKRKPECSSSAESPIRIREVTGAAPVTQTNEDCRSMA
jgi:hypothetical protein